MSWWYFKPPSLFRRWDLSWLLSMVIHIHMHKSGYLRSKTILPLLSFATNWFHLLQINVSLFTFFFQKKLATLIPVVQSQSQRLLGPGCQKNYHLPNLGWVFWEHNPDHLCSTKLFFGSIIPIIYAQQNYHFWNWSLNMRTGEGRNFLKGIVLCVLCLLHYCYLSNICKYACVMNMPKSSCLEQKALLQRVNHALQTLTNKNSKILWYEPFTFSFF